MKLPDNGRTEKSRNVSESNARVFAGPPTGHKGWKLTHIGGNLQTRWTSHCMDIYCRNEREAFFPVKVCL